MRVSPVSAGLGIWLATAAPDHGFAQSAAPPDKSQYTLFDPVPDQLMRDFNTDRPPKANSPYTVDAGHFQYETDIVNAAFDQLVGSVHTDTYLVPNPTFKLGLTNRIDLEVNAPAGIGSTHSMRQAAWRARCGASTTCSCAPKSISGATTAAKALLR